MIKAAQPGRAGTVRSTIVHLSVCRQRRACEGAHSFCKLLAPRTWNPPTSSSFADDKAVCSLLHSTAVRDFRRSQLGLQPAWLSQTILGSVSNSGYEEPVRSADSPRGRWSRSWSTQGQRCRVGRELPGLGTALAALHQISTPL